jgi:sugar phosphate isomerase/epimerase
MTHRILASTTSHKREALLDTLKVFSLLGLSDLDLNLHHIIEGGVSAETVAAAVASQAQQVSVVSGGWCDFFHGAGHIDETMGSVDRQVRIAERLCARTIRLFFGRLPREAYDRRAANAVVGNLRRLSEVHPHVTFVFENHDGASLVPEICQEILERVDRPNIRMNFDPMNFARAGVDPVAALALVQPLMGHMHLKGLDHGEFCEFGAGDVELTPILRQLIAQGYAGDFTVEYEGTHDGTLRLYRSLEHARIVIASLDAERHSSHKA